MPFTVFTEPPLARATSGRVNGDKLSQLALAVDISSPPHGNLRETSAFIPANRAPLDNGDGGKWLKVPNADWQRAGHNVEAAVGARLPPPTTTTTTDAPPC